MTDSLGASQSTNLSACDIASPSHGNAFTLQEGWRVLALHFSLTMQTNSEWCVGFLLISFQQKGKGLLIKMPFVFYRKSCPFSYGWRISLLKLGLLFFLCSDLRVTSCILPFSTYKPPQAKHSQVCIVQWLKYFQHKILSDTFCKIFPKSVTVAFPGNVKSQLTWRSALTEPSICQCWEGAVSSGGSCVGADMCAVLHTGDNSSPCWSWFFNAGNLVIRFS